MFDTIGFVQTKHVYTLAATGMNFSSKEFSSRQNALAALYEYLDQYGLTIKEIYDDKHTKTYICDGGIRFYISRMY